MGWRYVYDYSLEHLKRKCNKPNIFKMCNHTIIKTRQTKNTNLIITAIPKIQHTTTKTNPLPNIQINLQPRRNTAPKPNKRQQNKTINITPILRLIINKYIIT